MVSWLPILLGLVPLVLAAVALILMLLKPYALVREDLWLGPSKWIYVKNPMLKWLMFAQWPAALLWFLKAKPKAIWQWVAIVAALVAIPMMIFGMKVPPPFLG